MLPSTMRLVSWKPKNKRFFPNMPVTVISYHSLLDELYTY
jgi:hypothetical protein